MRQTATTTAHKPRRNCINIAFGMPSGLVRESLSHEEQLRHDGKTLAKAVRTLHISSLIGNFVAITHSLYIGHNE